MLILSVTNLHGLSAVNGDAVKVADGGPGGVPVDHRDEAVALAGVVNVCDFAAPAELVLDGLGSNSIEIHSLAQFWLQIPYNKKHVHKFTGSKCLQPKLEPKLFQLNCSPGANSFSHPTHIVQPWRLSLSLFR